VKNTLFSRYRWIIFYVLLVLACIPLRYAIVWYKSRPPNHVHVHDLTWPDRTDGEEGDDEGDVVYRRWRYFFKPRSYIPLKIEKYSRGEPNDDYVLEETLVISYPSTDEIRQVIKDTGF